jgi:hypothetical protein
VFGRNVAPGTVGGLISRLPSEAERARLRGVTPQRAGYVSAVEDGER